MTTSPPLRAAGGLRVRSLLLLCVLVPTAGLSAVVIGSVQDRWATRDASSALETATTELRAAAELRSAIAQEEIGSTLLGIAHDIGANPDEVRGLADGGVHRDLDAARIAVDTTAATTDPDLRDELGALSELRRALDRGEASLADVRSAFATVNAELADRWRNQMDQIEREADRRPLTGELRARLRTLRHSGEAFELAGPRINVALDILFDEVTLRRLAELVDVDARFASAAANADPQPGTEAAAAWADFEADPAATRTEEVLDTALAVALGEQAPWGDVPIEAVVPGLEDGARWGVLLTEIVEAAAADLGAAAGARAAADSDAAVGELVRAAALVALSVAMALLLARELLRPAADLEAAARRVEQGEFDIPPVRPRGPREITATVHAFNDMAATLAAVEDQTVALAEDPASSLLDEPLPGRTGQAMQAAIDRLRSAVKEAEAHRAELVELATRDALTGLLNRAAAFAAVDHDLAQARRDGQPLLALYVDLDGLKELNDSYGHDAGDQAIVRTAEALQATTREADIVARLGGDEFVVVGRVPPDGREGVFAFAERVRRSVSLQAVDVGPGRQVPLRCSVGIALSGAHADSAEDLVRSADTAMYVAKHSGRDRVAWFEPEAGPEHGPTSTEASRR